VQFSNDLEGFLPYTLVISDELGLEFKPVGGQHTEVKLDPLNVMKATRLDWESVFEDPVFAQQLKEVSERPGRGLTDVNSLKADVVEAERARPPYDAVVRLGVRRTVLEGGQVLVYIAVQSDRLGVELIRSCEQLRRRRAILYYGEPCYERALDPSASRSSTSRYNREDDSSPPPREQRLQTAQAASESEDERSRADGATDPSPTSPQSSKQPTTPPALQHIVETMTSTSSVLPNLGDVSPVKQLEMARPG